MKKFVFFGAVSVLAVLLVYSIAIAESKAEKPKQIEDGENLAFVVELVKQGDRPAFKVTDGNYKGKTFIVLENGNLEKLETMMKEQKLETANVDCEVTMYKNKNYLYLMYYQNPKDKEKEEDSPEEDPEGEEEPDYDDEDE